MRKVISHLKEKAGGRRFILVLAVSIFAIAIVVAALLRTGRGGVQPLPDNLVASSQAAAHVSKEIVKLANQVTGTVQKIGKIREEDGMNRIQELIAEAREKNGRAHAYAFDLSGHVQKMAESVSLISSRKSQQVAYEAIAIELALISEFLSYTRELEDFFDAVSKTTVSNSGPAGDLELLQTKLEAVNARTKVVNRLNDEFLVRIGQFSRSL